MTITTSAPPDTAPTPAPRPRPTARPGGTAAAREDRARLIQLIMFAVGGGLMPFGVLVICLGWYGSAHAHYEYDQNTYLISGGVLGVGIVLLGGFVYFGAWLARMAADQRRSAAQLTDAMLALADVVAIRARGDDAATGGYGAASGGYGSDLGDSELVRAGNNATVHRRDCPLIATRPDLHAYVETGGAITTCRVCKPEL